jgi:hypothetical protein
MARESQVLAQVRHKNVAGLKINCSASLIVNSTNRIKIKLNENRKSSYLN